MKRFKDIFSKTSLEPNDDLARANGQFDSSQWAIWLEPGIWGLKGVLMAALLLVSVTVVAQSTSTGVVVHGNVYGGGNLADVKTNTEVKMSAGTVEGNVYGGGNLGDVGTHADQDPVSVGNYDWKDQDGNTITNTTAAAKMTGVSKVTITGGKVGLESSGISSKDHGNVFGGGKGAATTFECEKGMVYKTNVSIKKSGTASTLVYRNVYGGGEVSRVENDTEVTIGTESGTDEPNIKGSVFAAGAGVETHGYSALVRGHSTVTVQGKATVEHNVYGGGELASVGRYKVKTPANASDTDVPATLPYGMPAHLINGGKNTVTIKDNAVIGTENDNTTGYVYGAGKGLEPREYDYKTQEQYGDIEGNNADDYDIDDHKPKRMVSGNTWEHFDDLAAYLQFVETLALTAETEVTITGSAEVIGSVFGGSESGFVFGDTDVKVQNGTINGNVFGGGRGLESFAEAGRVRGNTEVTMSNGSVAGNVYGGGNLGDVGTIYKDAKDENNNLTYNYVWRSSDANGNVNDTEHNNTTEYNKPSGSSHDTSKNTGICTVTINGGTIGTGVTQNSDGTFTKGNVYGAGRGTDITWWCEKAIAYATNVTITDGTVNGNVYGGGQIGRVEDDGKVTIGTAGATGESKPTIIGSVFGAGAGLHTHGYSALMRGNAEVTVQGTAQIGGSVYGGGETASVGKFEVVGGLPTKPKTGGICIVNIKDNAKIGASGTGHNVYGACKGVDPATINSSERKSMQLRTNAPDDTDLWVSYNNDDTSPFIWRYYATEQDYLDFLKTLALTSHPHVTIGGTWTPNETTGTITASTNAPTVYGSVYGGGQRGVTLGHVDVNMVGGIVEQDVYGGGALADTNLGNWDVNHYETATALNYGESITDLYTRTGAGTTADPYKYTKVTDANATIGSGTYYRQVPTWAHEEGSAYYKTTVDLTGGLIKGDAYGGGLGQLGDNPVEAVVWGDVIVTLGNETEDEDVASATAFTTTYFTSEGHTGVVKSGRVFGCNNLNGSPKGNVTVTVNRTVTGKDANGDDIIRTDIVRDGTTHEVTSVETPHTYEVAAVYGGGNLADYIPTTGEVKVIINSCYVSINEVYGGGNAAKVPSTDVLVKGAYEIEHLFGGGNGKDAYTLDGGTTWATNPGADIGGNTNTLIKGGYIHEAYGGSNEKGTITGNININTDTGGCAGCPVKYDKLVGAGKNADVNGDLIMILGCYPTTETPLIFAGADNANVNGNVELTITSGTFGKVFGGNNQGGAIKGHIVLNIEETGCNPINIDELYLGGNEAAYSRYGYYLAKDKNNQQLYRDAENTKPLLMPRESATDERKPVQNDDTEYANISDFTAYDQPILNVVSCTSIGKVFGGGYGVGGVMYADPTVNINMIPGAYANNMNTNTTDNPNKLGEIGTVYGGGNAADVIGDPTVNIGTEATVQCHVSVDASGNYTMGPVQNVLGAYITGNVYGGGKGEADNFFCDKAMIGKDGAGIIDADGDGEVDKDGGTTVNIFKGFVGGNVYGGGQIGRVEKNTVVTIGTGNGVEPGGTPTSAPIILGSVYGGGAGEEEHGYAALVRGNPTVTIQGNAKVRQSVYGGGEIASVARYKVPQSEDDVQAAIDEGYTEAALGMPYALKDASSGTCTVIVRGYAEIGPETAMQMTKAGGPDDTGYVFGAGKGILPGGKYEYANGTTKRMVLYDATVHTTVGQEGSKWQWVDPDHSDTNKNVWEYFADLNEYIKFIQTLALSSRTYVTITDNAFVKGSVYGGSENGIVQFNTDVKIQGGQIGCGKDETEAHPDDYWTTNSEDPTKFADCSSWEFKEPYDSYDPNAKYKKEADGKYYYNSGYTQDAAGGAVVATDGHTYYGNVFGGGSGSIPYFDATKGQSVYLHSAGQVKGNTNVTISGGHILTNVYGGCETTNVEGTANVTMTGGTVGVPRTDEQIIAHPLTGYIFGGGKGDQRIFFNKDTNVKDAVVTVEGGRVYGSVYGGGEDGHVLRNVTLTIGKQTTTGEGDEAVTTTSGLKIGTKGTSYYDGHVFGGGRGFGGDALTAGNVGGSVDVNILDGEILGSVYGGGRLASVGYGLYLTTENGYGEMRADNEYDGSYTNPSTDPAGTFFNKGRGHINMTISGGTIGNDNEYAYDANNQLSHTKGGNVFAGGMGRMCKLDGTTPISSLDWWKLGCVKSTKLTITGGTIKSNVYGGGELGMVQGGNHTSENNNPVSTEIIINGGTIGTEVTEKVNNVDITQYTFGSVFGGGYGSLTEKLDHTGSTNPTYSTYKYTYPKYIAGRVKGSTEVTMTDGEVLASVYGGGEMAAVGESKVLATSTDPVVLGETLTGNNGTSIVANTYVTISGGTIGKSGFGGAKMGNVYGGGSGHNNTVRSGHVYGNTNVTINEGSVSGEPKIYHNIYGGGAYGSVGDFVYTTTLDPEAGVQKVSGITGLHTERTNTGTANVTITGGTIGYDGNENGMVFGSSRGDINQPGARDDYTAWVYDANVIIGTEGSETGPQIKGTVYGSGENGHTYNNTVVTVYSGTIGIAEGSPIGTYTEGGAAYPYRGNVYGGGCGTDTYPVTVTEGQGQSAVTKTIQAFNPLAGIVYGNTTVNINGGTVVRNVYGAGAMGSVGKTTWTTTSTTTGDVTTTTKSATTSGGSTTININGGIIGVSGTVGDGNVFGAARGSKAVVQADRDDLSRVSVTNVNVSGGLVKGNVYGGGELGDVGTIVKNTTDYNYTWEKSDGGSNVAENNKITGTNTNTGICNVTITGGTIGSTTAGTGNVFGGGKGDANTWWCEKAMAFAANVSISKGNNATAAPVVYGTVYGGGEVGRVEDDTKVIIGTANGSDEPDIKGNVFGAGKGMATRGYSALVRGNSIVTIQGSAKVGGNVFGGGEEASLGRFNLVGGLPKSPASGGSSEVTIQDNAKIGSSGTGNHVYGAGQGVNPNYVTDTTNPNKYKDYKSMQLETNKPIGDEGDTWDYYVDDDGHTDENFVWVYYKTEPEYQAFLNTLALASHPTVTIAENATVYGDVYGGGQRGITMGNVEVNITGGTVKRDVYGGGSLADTNKGNWDADRYVEATVTTGESVAGLYTMTTVDNKPVYTPTAANATAVDGATYYRKGTWAADKYNTTTHVTTFKTNVNLTGGTVIRNVYGGGLGQLSKAAVGTQGQAGYTPAVSPVEAKVYGDVSVVLNKPTTPNDDNTYGECEVKGTIFGCNNLNGSPQAGVDVHVYKTVQKDDSGNVIAKPDKDTDTYEVTAVYGGGNLAAYYPDDETTRTTAQTNVIIDGCGLTSIKTVYGGGNAASVPATEVTVNGTYEIGQVFGGGNGADNYELDGIWYQNPGANVGYLNYTHWETASVSSPGTETQPYQLSVNNTTADEDAHPDDPDYKDASSKAKREANYKYGTGKAHATIYGGTVHEVYGGSNTRGNVRVEARTTLEDEEVCQFDVGEAYGGGRNAPMDGDAVLDIGCIRGMGKAYGGAADADVNGNVVLNITNGTYGQVFGGNDAGGAIRGSITVNIQETGCNPIVIGELYGGGNEAAYSVYGYETDEQGKAQPLTSLPLGGTKQADPQVNIYSFTSIGTIYGGGYGETATMVGNPTVNIDVYEGKYAEKYNNKDNVIDEDAKVVGSTVTYSESDNGFPIPSHAKGAIGAIGTVFGGGNAAKVIGNTMVNVGTKTGEDVYEVVVVPVGQSVAGYYTRTGDGTTEHPYTYSDNPLPNNAVADSSTTYCQKKIFKGVDIRGNVYGGGNAADVTGDTKVQIGKKVTE